MVAILPYSCLEQGLRPVSCIGTPEVPVEYRGPILIVFGMSLVLSAIAINMNTTKPRALIGQVETTTEAACNETSMLSPRAKMLCLAQRESIPTQRVLEGRAVFLTPQRRTEGGAVFVTPARP
jgi:hypothetical protein